MTSTGKDTIYIDVDDEITGIIDKVTSSKERIIAVVLPKRAAVLQSTVNMKLLKRAAEASKKRLVLITSEAALLPIAGAAGLHVAKNLQSKPSIPSGGVLDDSAEELQEGDSVSFSDPTGEATDGVPDPDDFDADAASGTSIGDLAGSVPAAAAAGDDLETIEMDSSDDDEKPADAAATDKKPKKDKKDKKNKKLAVPNFNRFRLLLVLGGVALVILIFVIYLCVAVLPKATVTLTTDTSDIKTSATLTLDPKATSVDTDGGTVPAGFQQKQQSSSQQVPTTGQQNNGQPATGSITMTAGACSANIPDDVPAGTGVSTNGLTFITQQDASFIPVSSGKKCIFQSSSSINITAQKPGSTYNGASPTTVAGRSDVTAKADNPTSGGTDNIVKVVAQADIDSAQAKLAAQDSSAIKQTLTQQLEQAGYKAIDATFSGGTPSTSPSASVGTPSDTVSVTQVVTYTMYGVKNSDIKTFLAARINKQIDPSKQTVLDDGVSGASYKVTSTSPEQVSIQATSVAGPDIKTADIQKQVAGQKAGPISDELKLNPGVTNVKVSFSPFWVDSAPKKTSKIKVVFQKSSDANP